MRVIVVGQSPARGWEDAEPIIGLNSKGERCGTGKTWIAWSRTLGLDWRRCEYYNVSQMTRLEWDLLTNSASGKSTLFIALGKVAEKAVSESCRNWVALPHPSGRNRLLNDKKYLLACLREARDTVSEYGYMITNLRRIGGW